MKSYRHFFNYRDPNLVHSLDTSPKQKPRSHLPSRSYSRKASHTPQDLTKDYIHNNNYFLNSYQQHSQKMRSYSQQSRPNKSLNKSADKNNIYYRPPSGMKGHTIDVSQGGGVNTQQDKKNTQFEPIYNQKIFNNYLNHTINVDIDVKNTNNNNDSNKKQNLNSLQQQQINKSFNQKYEKLKNLYVRNQSGVKSSQNQYINDNPKIVQNQNNSHNVSAGLNGSPRETYSRQKLYGGYGQNRFRKNHKNNNNPNQNQNSHQNQQGVNQASNFMNFQKFYSYKQNVQNQIQSQVQNNNNNYNNNGINQLNINQNQIGFDDQLIQKQQQQMQPQQTRLQNCYMINNENKQPQSQNQQQQQNNNTNNHTNTITNQTNSTSNSINQTMENLDKLIETISTRDNTRESNNRKQNIKKTQLQILQPKKSLDMDNINTNHNMKRTLQKNNLISRNKRIASFDRTSTVHQSIKNEKQLNKGGHINHNLEIKKQYATIDVMSQSMYENENAHNTSLQEINLSQGDIKKEVTFALKCSFRTKQGVLASNPNKTNQDSYVICQNFCNKTFQTFFTVCDGHGTYGHLVSQFIKHHLPIILQQESGLLLTNPKQALFNGVGMVNHKLSMTEIDCTFSGTTLISVLLKNDKLYTANVGDSRAILGRYIGNKWENRSLSRDHKPGLHFEAERILRNGGRIDSFRDQEGNPLGPLRVWLKKENIPGLAMSRSIGDNVATSVGVTWEPEIFEFNIEKNDKFLVIASDGVWEFIENIEVVNLIAPYYENDDIEGACEALLKESHARWTYEDDSVIDDITFVLVFIEHDLD